jgi:hypothetical protein
VDDSPSETENSWNGSVDREPEVTRDDPEALANTPQAAENRRIITQRRVKDEKRWERVRCHIPMSIEAPTDVFFPM